MALVPKINICVNTKCASIDVYEETSPYHSTTNLEGWRNSSVVSTAWIDTSEITTYTVTGNSTTFTNIPQYELVTCSICSCIDGLKAKLVTGCDGLTLADTKEKIDQLQLILYGIETAFSCADFVTATSLIASAKTICDNLCDCGCGDCA